MKVGSSTDSKHCSTVQDILSTVNLTSNGLGSNPGLRSEGSVQGFQDKNQITLRTRWFKYDRD